MNQQTTNQNGDMTNHARSSRLRVVLCAVNAKYSHTSLSVRALRQACSAAAGEKLEILTAEFSINEQTSSVLQKLYEYNADIYAFSCYIWNIEMITRLSRDLRQVRPDLLIIWGGPESGWQQSRFLAEGMPANIILSGEGELNLPEVISRCLDADILLPLCSDCDRLCSGISGAAWRTENQKIKINSIDRQLRQADWFFPYKAGELNELAERILYYESSRGCPFGCTYCMSSRDRVVRYRDLEVVFAELEQFIQTNVRLVKFVDRTFNCDQARANKIWLWLINRYQKRKFRTRFHFEISGDLIDDSSLNILQNVPDGLFQFEIGVQSCQPEVLRLAGRKCDLPKLFANMEYLREKTSIHLHLDLIAGLPGESLQAFSAGFDKVMKLKPQMLQLGFLKVLPGSIMYEQARDGNMHWQDYPPYEILISDSMSYADLVLLKRVEHQLDMYYNSGNFELTVNWLLAGEPSAFKLFAELADEYRGAGWEDRQIGRQAIWEFLLDFAVKNRSGMRLDLLRDHLLLDYLRKGNKDTPEWQQPLDLSEDTKAKQSLAYGRQIMKIDYPECRRYRIERFSCSPDALINERYEYGEWLAAFNLSGKKPSLLWQINLAR